MALTKINIPEGRLPRVVILGGGFAGLKLARKLSGRHFQVVLLDRNNFHQFQPLFYQVAMAGLEPSSIAFPFRRLFRSSRNYFIRVTEVDRIEQEEKRLHTPLGIVNYDYLVIATGATTNFFGNEHIARLAIPMKSVSEALYLRNTILSDYEKAITATEYGFRQGYLDIVIVGGGPTGVEVAGALAEMRKYIIPKDYPEIDNEEIDIHLVQGGGRLLEGMSERCSGKALEFLQQLGVKVWLNLRVTDYDGEYAYLSTGEKIYTRKLIWAAGVRGNCPPGLPETVHTRGRRIKVDEHLRVEGFTDIFAIGDIAYMEEAAYPHGHPQVAQVALQQGKYLARYLRNAGKDQPPFRYQDLGSMATIGRHKAVVDLPRISFQGFFAWLIWLFVHLFQILGAKNKVFVFINWVWNYFTYDQSLRLIIRPRVPQGKQRVEIEE